MLAGRAGCVTGQDIDPHDGLEVLLLLESYIDWIKLMPYHPLMVQANTAKYSVETMGRISSLGKKFTDDENGLI